MVESPVLFDYLPNYAVPPGDTLAEVLDERGMSQAELAQRTDLSPKHINRIVNGHVPISAEVAIRLERATDVPARLWLSLEATYREHLARLDESALAPDLPLLEELPIAAMVKLGILTKRLGKNDRLREVLMYLGVANRNAWRKTLKSQEASFRMSTAHRCDPAVVAVWLRMGEIEAAEIDCAPWDPSRFKEVLRQVRGLTRAGDPTVWQPELVELCASAGIAFVAVPEVDGARTNGAARWLTPNKGLIQLSIRGRWSDIFWFSFFHEASHILDQAKRPIFLSGKNKDSPDEQKADQFAQSFLIPPDRADELRRLRSAIDVQDFAASVGVHPGIVVGRLQHEGIWNYSQGHTLRSKLQFVQDPSTESP